MDKGASYKTPMTRVLSLGSSSGTNLQSPTARRESETGGLHSSRTQEPCLGLELTTKSCPLTSTRSWLF